MPHQDAIRILIEETDPARRVEAHILLGRRALERADVATALSHFRLAIAIDPTHERARASLLELEGARGRPRGEQVTFLRWLLRRGRAEA